MNLSDLKPRFAGPTGPTGAIGPIGVTGPTGPIGATGAGGTQAYWGSFWSNQDQSAVSANTEYAITLNNTDPASLGVSIVSGSRITFIATGVYSITFSVQFKNTDTQEHDADIWLKKNGINIPDTNSTWSVPSTHGGLDGHTIGTVNFVLALSAGDYIQLFWKTDNTGVTLDYSAAASPAPVTPSVVVTATQVTYTQAGPTGATGVFVGDAATITTGTLGDARLSSNVTLGGNNFTGTGKIVRETSPTLTTPALGAATASSLTISQSSWNLLNITVSAYPGFTGTVMRIAPHTGGDPLTVRGFGGYQGGYSTLITALRSSYIGIGEDLNSATCNAFVLKDSRVSVSFNGQLGPFLTYAGFDASDFRAFNTYTNSTNYERANLRWVSNVFTIATEAAGTGTARALAFTTGGTTRMTISATGDITTTNSVFNGYRLSSRTITASTTLLNTDSIVLVSAASGAVVITLPNAATVAGQVFEIKRTDSSANQLSITDASSSIDGQASVLLTNQYMSLTVTSNGTAYFII